MEGEADPPPQANDQPAVVPVVVDEQALPPLNPGSGENNLEVLSPYFLWKLCTLSYQLGPPNGTRF